jgi:hypothetical protein
MAKKNSGWGLSNITNTLSSAVNGHSNGHKGSEAEKEAFVPATTGDVFSGGRCGSHLHTASTHCHCAAGHLLVFRYACSGRSHMFCDASCICYLRMHAANAFALRLLSGCKCADLDQGAISVRPICCVMARPTRMFIELV